jgi:hypothetical protein
VALDQFPNRRFTDLELAGEERKRLLGDVRVRGPVDAQIRHIRIHHQVAWHHQFAPGIHEAGLCFNQFPAHILTHDLALMGHQPVVEPQPTVFISEK